jgi:hypothetical protein
VIPATEYWAKEMMRHWRLERHMSNDTEDRAKYLREYRKARNIWLDFREGKRG